MWTKYRTVNKWIWDGTLIRRVARITPNSPEQDQNDAIEHALSRPSPWLYFSAFWACLGQFGRDSSPLLRSNHPKMLSVRPTVQTTAPGGLNNGPSLAFQSIDSFFLLLDLKNAPVSFSKCFRRPTVFTSEFQATSSRWCLRWINQLGPVLCAQLSINLTSPRPDITKHRSLTEDDSMCFLQQILYTCRANILIDSSKEQQST
jgi:hypothetical protein